MTSRALPRLLAFALAACGGRYSTSSDTAGSAGTPGAAGTQGKAGAAPDDAEPGGGVGMPGTAPGQGGRSSGTGGGGVGVGKGGTGFGFAGTFGSAGTMVGTAGTNAGNPVTNLEICNRYCLAFANACTPNASPAACSKMCLGDLNSANDCYAQREAYECLAGVFTAAPSCENALFNADRLCNSPNGQPMACDEPACTQEIFGDGTGCHAITRCASGEADLQCLETGGTPICTCWVNGKVAVELMTGASSSKAACTDDELRRLCMQQLP